MPSTLPKTSFFSNLLLVVASTLLGSSQLAERLGTREDQHRQRRELRCADATGRVLPPEPAQQVDRRRVQAVRHSDGRAF